MPVLVLVPVLVPVLVLVLVLWLGLWSVSSGIEVSHRDPLSSRRDPADLSPGPGVLRGQWGRRSAVELPAEVIPSEAWARHPALRGGSPT